MVCPHGQGGRGSIFRNLCGRLLWTAPYADVIKLRHLKYVIKMMLQIFFYFHALLPPLSKILVAHLVVMLACRVNSDMTQIKANLS